MRVFLLKEKMKVVSSLIIDILSCLHFVAQADESYAECPNCGAIYGTIDCLWVCCDGCDSWFDINCTLLNPNEIPDVYYCNFCLA